MTEAEIRRALIRVLEREHADEETLIVEEFGLCRGSARIDVALVNSVLHGFEIKSNRDRLDRLAAQIEAYSRCFEFITVVAAARHIRAIQEMVPPWCGITEVKESGAEVSLSKRRLPQLNHSIEPLTVAQLLWRNESIELLASHDLDAGFRSKPRAILWQRLASCLPCDELLADVRAKLRVRGDWRSASRRRSSGGSLRLGAMSLHSPARPFVLRSHLSVDRPS